MQSRPTKLTIKMGGKVHEITQSTVRTRQESFEKAPSAIEGTDQNDENTLSCDDSQKQMVLYDPSQNGEHPDGYKPRPLCKHVLDTRKVVPEVGAFTVQCANCLKWRLIPDQDTYEIIREHITDQPFLCETTRQWDRDVSCDDPTDIEQDGSRIWAIDKPNIARPPPGWKRLLRLRSEGSSKFADVYYTSPTGVKLRSMPDVTRYMENHPEIAHGIEIKRFSFQIPRPLGDNYVRKRRTQIPAPETPEYLEPSPVEPISWMGPGENLDLQIAEPLSWAGPAETRNGMPVYVRTPEFDPVNRAAKKARQYDMDCL